jgi:hypothetical protein
MHAAQPIFMYVRIIIILYTPYCRRNTFCSIGIKYKNALIFFFFLIVSCTTKSKKERLTEAKNRRQISKLSIANALWYGQTSDGYTGDQVRLEQLQSILRRPF